MAEIIIKKEVHECPPAVVAYIKELKKENARLEELYQKSVGVIAATDCVECKNKVYRKAYNDVMKIRANIQEIIEDIERGADKLKQRLPTFSSVIYEMPTIDAEPVKHGYWIETSSPYHFKCSSCGVIANIKFHSVEDHKFCWHCGAKMDGESE